MIRFAAGIFLSLLSGAMFLLAFPAYGGCWFLAVFAAAPLD